MRDRQEQTGLDTAAEAIQWFQKGERVVEKMEMKHENLAGIKDIKVCAYV